MPKAQHSDEYRPLMELLRALREEAELTQRDLGGLLGKPQSWIHNCEVGNRRVDVAEFAAWARACGVEPAAAFARFLSTTATRAKPARPKPRRT
jgi:transcriptional regulator with XRE-family HTH domain